MIIAVALGKLGDQVHDQLTPYEYKIHESHWWARRFIHRHDSPNNLLLACADGRDASRLAHILNTTKPLSYAQTLVLTVDPWWSKENLNRQTMKIKVPVTRIINVAALDSGALVHSPDTTENRIVHGYDRSTVAESPHVKAALRELVLQAREK